MLRLLLVLLLLALPLTLPSQVVLTTYKVPTVITVTAGASHCTAWFHASVAPPYDAEIACYTADGTVKFVEVQKADVTFTGNWNFDGGNIFWQIRPMGNLQSNVSVGGQGPLNSSPVIAFAGVL